MRLVRPRIEAGSKVFGVGGLHFWLRGGEWFDFSYGGGFFFKYLLDWGGLQVLILPWVITWEYHSLEGRHGYLQVLPEPNPKPTRDLLPPTLK